MSEILFLGVKSDVRSALNRLNRNWPQTRQDFAVDNAASSKKIVIKNPVQL